MSSNKGKRLAADEYRLLRLAVLERDGWRCQCCGSLTRLEVHHQHFLSRMGGDAEENLITLCHACHETIHRC